MNIFSNLPPEIILEILSLYQDAPLISKNQDLLLKWAKRQDWSGNYSNPWLLIEKHWINFSQPITKRTPAIFGQQCLSIDYFYKEMVHKSAFNSRYYIQEMVHFSSHKTRKDQVSFNKWLSMLLKSLYEQTFEEIEEEDGSITRVNDLEFMKLVISNEISLSLNDLIKGYKICQFPYRVLVDLVVPFALQEKECSVDILEMFLGIMKEKDLKVLEEKHQRKLLPIRIHIL